MADFEMCQECARLIGADRHTKPHTNLVADGSKQEFAGYGVRADEQRYVCTTCGQQWMHETGNSGRGWTAQSAP